MCLLFLALAGCGPRTPASEASIPLGLETRFYAPQGWAWGRVGIEGGPSLRYGAASPTVAPKAQVLILPDQGEPAEAWFETARSLLARRYGVWVLDWSGLGGPTGRFGVAARGHGFPEVAAPVVRLMAGQVIRAEQPLIVLASGSGADPALRALVLHLPVDAVILSSPRKADSAVQTSHDPKRQRVIELWGRADTRLKPDDRFNLHDRWMRWRKPAQAPVLERVAAPVTILASGLEESCAGLPKCRLVRLGRAREPLHLERDALRDVWLKDVAEVIEARTAGRSVATPPTPVSKTP
ncbi:MAG: hypothetical protein ABIO39_05575 [Caulobacteraceae bacterium]